MFIQIQQIDGWIGYQFTWKYCTENATDALEREMFLVVVFALLLSNSLFRVTPLCARLYNLTGYHSYRLCYFIPGVRRSQWRRSTPLALQLKNCVNCNIYAEAARFCRVFRSLMFFVSRTSWEMWYGKDYSTHTLTLIKSRWQILLPSHEAGACYA